jgi:hypothetical protein
MHEMPVSGEIKTIAMREGSSGIFTGSIEGLYQGYRFGSTTPDEREFTLEAPSGAIALVLRQQIVTPLPPRPAEHPFADGRDPFDDLAAGRPPTWLGGGGPPPGVHGGPPPGVQGGGPPPGVQGGGPPPGVQGGGPPPGVQGGGPPPGVEGGHGGPPGGAPGGGPPGEAPGIEGGQEIFKRVHYMEVKLQVVPEKSTGIFEGATGEMELFAPGYKMAGYTLINTEHGDLKLDFLEQGTRELLQADLWVNGEDSTGIWKNARGELEFSLTVTPPFYGRGPYSGTILLENEPPAA